MTVKKSVLKQDTEAWSALKCYRTNLKTCFFRALRITFLYNYIHLFGPILHPATPFAISNTVVSQKVKVPYQERKIPTVLDKRNGPLTLRSERSSVVVQWQRENDTEEILASPLRPYDCCTYQRLIIALDFDWLLLYFETIKVLRLNEENMWDIQRNIKKNIYLYCLKNRHLTSFTVKLISKMCMVAYKGRQTIDISC